MTGFGLRSTMMMSTPTEGIGNARYQPRAQGGGLNPCAREFIPSKGRKPLRFTAGLNPDAVEFTYRGPTIRRHGALSSDAAATATKMPVLEPTGSATTAASASASKAAAAAAPTAPAEASAVAEVESMLDALIGSVFEAAEVGALAANAPVVTKPESKAWRASPAQEVAVEETEAVRDARAENSSGPAASEIMAEAAVAERTAGPPAAGWAVRAEARGEPARAAEEAIMQQEVAEVVVADKPVVTTAGPAAGWAALAEARDGSAVMKEEVANEVRSSGRRRRWTGGRAGVWLVVGAGVTIGAALWARRR